MTPITNSSFLRAVNVLKGLRRMSLEEFCLKTGLDSQSVEDYVLDYQYGQSWRELVGYKTKVIDTNTGLEIQDRHRVRFNSPPNEVEKLVEFVNYTYTSPSRTLDLFICKEVFGVFYKFGDYESYEEYNSQRRGYIIDPEHKYSGPFGDDEVPHFSSDIKHVNFLMEKLQWVEVVSKDGFFIVRSRSFRVKHTSLPMALSRLLYKVWTFEK